jgi:L,D-transpeptidase YcbB
VRVPNDIDRIIIVLLWMASFCFNTVQGQLTKEVASRSGSLKHPQLVKSFYEHNGNRLAWINNKSAVNQLLIFLETSEDLGLRKMDYKPDYLQAFNKGALTLLNFEDTLAADIRISDIAISFFKDISVGRLPPRFGYNGLEYSPDCLNIPFLISTSLSSHTLHLFFRDIEPRDPQYLALKNRLIWLNKMGRDTAEKIKLHSSLNLRSQTKRELLKRLYQLGIVNAHHEEISDQELKEVIRQAQYSFSLKVDGIARQSLVNELNIPLSVRREQLSIALNTFRWLRCIRNENAGIIVVNIPSATLMLFQGDKVSLESRVIVGKGSTPTPVFCSRVDEVILYPYWVVPKSIATKEILPIVKKDPGYLDRNNFQVLNTNGKILNPSTINWHQLTAVNFSYTFRQSTGCDNSLGIVKLSFNSPYGVYLHDTPAKALFNSDNRFYSHGCIRVQKALQVARFALKNNTTAIDTLKEDKHLINQKPIVLPASEKTPLFVLYNTVWVDSLATVRFYRNPYRNHGP